MKKLFEKIQRLSREKKFNLFMNLFPSANSILDVGCGRGTFLEDMYPSKHSITGLELSSENILAFRERHTNIRIIKGDAKKMPFTDKQFDVTFSNAVIEHVGGFKEQRKFAKEVVRVGKHYFVTTPNKLFPFEPHYRLPLMQFMPKTLQRSLSTHFSLGNYKKGEWEEINLLTARQLQRLFPDARIIKQRVTFYTETLIAVG